MSQENLYTDEVLTALTNLIEGKDFGIAQNTSNDPSVLAERIDYFHTIGLHRHGLPEIILVGNYPSDMFHHMVKQLMIDMSAPAPEDRDFLCKLDMVNGRGQKAFATTVPLSAYNQERYGKVFEFMYPDQEIKMVQLMMPDDNGVLPDAVPYVNKPASGQYFLGDVPEGVELYRNPPPVEDAPIEVEEIPKEDVSIIETIYGGITVQYTAGMTALDMPELIIVGNFPRENTKGILEYVVGLWKQFGVTESTKNVKLQMQIETDDPEKPIICTTDMGGVDDFFKSITDPILTKLSDKPYTLRQIILPDSRGRLPGDADYDTGKDCQLLLDSCGDVPDEDEVEPIKAYLVDGEEDPT